MADRETFTCDYLRSRLKRFHTSEYSWSRLGKSKLDALPKAAVLIPLVVDRGQIFIWLTERSQDVRNDKGHVAFPGGMKDDGDSDAVDTSLREAEEEIGLHRNQVEVVCELIPRINIRRTLISPVVGIVDVDFQPMSNPSEVSRTFCVPLKQFLHCQDHWVIKFEEHPEMAHCFSNSINGGPVITWGLTAAYCIELACAVFNSPTEFVYFGDARLYPGDPFMYRRYYLNKFIQELDAEEVNILHSKL